jgi:hypothetical protein
MKLPIQPFQKSYSKAAENSYTPKLLPKTSFQKKNFQDLQTHIAYLKRLTDIVLPVLQQVLPGFDTWQVASLEGELLCIATDQHSAASQLKYLQHHVLKALEQRPEFAAVRRIKVVIEIQPTPKIVNHGRLPDLSPEVRQILDDAASAFLDSDISDTLRRLARDKR